MKFSTKMKEMDKRETEDEEKETIEIDKLESIDDFNLIQREEKAH